EYEPRYIVDYDVDYRVRGNTGHLEIESILRRESNIDTKRNECNIVLSTRYPTRLDLDVGACDAELDLGGIPLEELTIDIGAASGKVVFSTPNPVRMEVIDIDAGAASLDFNMIGNANFEQFSFDGGAGSFDLDFRGEYDGESTISIAIGLGSTDIILPEGIPIRIETGNAEWLSSVDIHNDDLEEVRDDIFESSDFDDAETRIILELDIGLGSADLFWKE
ncbi:MAG: hypothetical protein U9R56_00710, partial [candidate division Zixibacteria bacterium]|nr:hypothetical protein [candidate division Zixibacteria bacterium]